MVNANLQPGVSEATVTAGQRFSDDGTGIPARAHPGLKTKREERLNMASSNQRSGHQGSMKDPAHDSRLKENREAGQTMGTAHSSHQRAEERGKEPMGSSHSSGSHQSGSHESGQSSGSHSSGSHSSGSHSSGSHSSGGHSPGSQHSQSASHSGSDDMKSREYKDEHGEVHHHTKKYMDENKGG
jgi:hypothetical protein